MAKLPGKHSRSAESASQNTSTTSSSLSDASGLTLNINATGKPIFIALTQGNPGSTNLNVVEVAKTSNAMVSIEAEFHILRGATIIHTSTVRFYLLHVGNDGSTPDQILAFPAGGAWCIDRPAPGSYTYKIQWKVNSGNSQLLFFGVKLVAYELN